MRFQKFIEPMMRSVEMNSWCSSEMRDVWVASPSDSTTTLFLLSV